MFYYKCYYAQDLLYSTAIFAFVFFAWRNANFLKVALFYNFVLQQLGNIDIHIIA